MDLSVVIPVRNGVATLRVQLEALLAQAWDGSWEIVVIDNGSTDGTVELATEIGRLHPRVRVESVTDCTGAAAVRNGGVARARGAAVAFCDADDIVGPAWVAAMGSALRDHEAVTGPLEVALLNPAWLVRTRGTPSLTEVPTFHGCFPTLPAGNFGMQMAAWTRVGGFDETVLANEDADLALRAFLRHVPVHFAPDALVHYRYRDTPRVLFDQGLRYGTYRTLVARRARRARVEGVPRFAGWRSWLLIVAWLPRTRTREGRASWAWVAGVRFGILRGCLRYRVLYL